VSSAVATLATNHDTPRTRLQTTLVKFHHQREIGALRVSKIEPSNDTLITGLKQEYRYYHALSNSLKIPKQTTTLSKRLQALLFDKPFTLFAWRTQ